VKIGAALAVLAIAACDQRSQGERLARSYCATCHLFPEPALLDKKSWTRGVLPQMGIRMGIADSSINQGPYGNPYIATLAKPVSKSQWNKIVAYYRANAPDVLPPQSLPATPALDPPAFTVSPFVPQLQSTGIVTLLEADSTSRHIFVGEGGTNLLRVFDWQRRLVASVTLGSPPTSVLVDSNRVLVLESGILNPNDEPRGTLAQYTLSKDSLRFDRVLIDSLFRPVYMARLGDAFVICEFGNNRGRLALYRPNGARYERQLLASSPGAIRVEVRDLTGDGKPDIVALFAQGDERIVLFVNDGTGHFGNQQVLARFPPVYGSMFFSMHDVNGDGHPDIVYVNGDNFDFSRVLKPYHGVTILENDGANHFRRRYFFPLYGAAQAIVADFDRDGDLDLLIASNFADAQNHPERGVVYLENTGNYSFKPYAFSAAASNEWNVMTAADLNGDGRLDVLVGAMDLRSVMNQQRRYSARSPQSAKDPILYFENRVIR
jgi:FG-GAP-like repeat